MTFSHLTGCVLAVVLAAATAAAQQPAPAQKPAPAPSAESTTQFLVFLRSQPMGREEVVVLRLADGYVVRGSSRLGPPIDITSRVAEVHYDLEWRPRSLHIDGVVRGQDVALKTAFEGGRAKNVIAIQGKEQPKDDAVSADTAVLPNSFLGSYAALARKLEGKRAGAELRGYIAPQAEIGITVNTVAQERIDTPRGSIQVVHYGMTMHNPPPLGNQLLNLWCDTDGNLIRLSMPAQGLEMAREDVASAASRTAAFSVPGDEAVTIAALGFNLGATITRPAGVAAAPALILISGSGPTDRDETVAGIPIFGHLARDLVAAGFAVVRYDKRGVGQSGGRAESATLIDYAEDARAVLRWLERRPDVDKDRLAIVGHSEGAAVAMVLASREKRVKAAVLIAGPGTTGAELVLEQQRHQLDLMKVDATERATKIALQEQIHSALLKGANWDGVPDAMRRAADTPWFQSLLAFDPGKVMKDVDQPLLIVQGELDTQVPPHHADKLVAMAEARKKKTDVELLRVPGINHLLVPARTGEVSEYGSLNGSEVAPAVPAGIGAWLAKTLGEGRSR